MNSQKRNQLPFERLPNLKRHQQVNYCDNRIIIELGKPKPKKNSKIRLLNQGKIYYRKSPSSHQRRPNTTTIGRSCSQKFIQASGSRFVMQTGQSKVLNIENFNKCGGQYSCLNFDDLGHKTLSSIVKAQGKQNRLSQLKEQSINPLKSERLNFEGKKSNRKQEQLPVNSKLKQQCQIAFTESQKRIKQAESIKQQRQKLMRLYNPVLELFKHPIYSESVTKPMIQPFFDQSVIVELQNSNIQLSKKSPAKQKVPFFQRAPIVKYLEGCRQQIQKYNQILELGQFQDDYFGPKQHRITTIDGKQIEWIEQQVDQTKISIFPQVIELPKDFISMNDEYKNKPIGIINTVNALLYVDPDIIKNIIQPDNQIFYSMWLFHNVKLSFEEQGFSKDQNAIENCNTIEPIFVDKFLPYDGDMNCPFIFGNNQLWFSVLTKCFAKIFGGYDKLCYLTQVDAYKAITGIEARKIRKQLIASVQQFKNHTTAQMGKGYVLLYKRKNTLGILNKVGHQKMTIFVPLKGQTSVAIADFFKDKQSDLLMIRSEAHWFTNTLTFKTPKQSLYSFYLSCQRQTRLYISTSNAVNKVYIYDLVGQNQKKQQMNVRTQSNENYIDTNLQRGNYKIFLQFGKKHISDYFNNFKPSNNKLKKKKQESPQYKMTLLSCQQLVLRQGGQIREHGEQIIGQKSSFYCAPSNQPTHKKKQFHGYANQQY